jgi:tripartite-type tricarboxylate transporter receptor subunit TctC
MVIISKKGVEAKDLKELAEWMKANSDKITLAHAGVGSNSHVCGLLIEQVLGKKFTFAAYRGTGPAMNDLVGGAIDVMCDQSTNAVPQIVGGTVKAYAVLSTSRLNSINEIPTSTEAGLPNLQMVLYNGLYAPKGTPKETVTALNGALQKALADKSLTDKFADVGTTPFANNMRSPEAHAKFFIEDMDRQAEMFKAAGIQPGNAN